MSTKLAALAIALVAVGCGPSAEEQARAEQKAKEEAMRQMVEQAASQTPQFVPADGGPATRPLVPAGFGKTEGAPWAQVQPVKAESPAPQ